MYLGRIVGAGMSTEAKISIAYRVSSRSFPNRMAKIFKNTISIIPKEGCEKDIFANPYIAYNCLRIAGDWAVASNGTHTDPIAEKIIAGMPPRDAIALSLLSLDYEKDSYNTPRICATVNGKEKRILLGIIKKQALQVEELEAIPGRFYYLSTYEYDSVCKKRFEENFNVNSAEQLCEYVISGGAFANFANPVSSAAAIFENSQYSLAVKNL